MTAAYMLDTILNGLKSLKFAPVMTEEDDSQYDHEQSLVTNKKSKKK